nr:cytochrome c oxidase subunit 3 [Oxylipeurus chiniri]
MVTKKGFHPFHMVEESPWPIITAFSAFVWMSFFYFYICSGNISLVVLGVVGVIFCVSQWWRDVLREATFQGCHSSFVQKGIYMGVVLFILSEVMFFFSFFFGFFFTSLNPEIEIGCWPPSGVEPLSFLGAPFFNTLLLLSSGVSVTWAHHSILEKNYKQSIFGLLTTVLLGFLFIFFQGMEYFECSFTIADSVFGSIFFLATGFHGLHVIIGATFLLVCLILMMKGYYSSSRHLGFEAAAWYWHFVDVVWLYLFVFIYWWGS